ncbi:MAG: transporter substrate-binding domain-containing protein [Paramuribaculum sp.]|nr:transporter substrate-binding domain-containing protein [Paramuribaculum sp.]
MTCHFLSPLPRTVLPVLSALALLFSYACGSGNSSADRSENVRHTFPDTLRVGTLYSPLSYYLYREEPMGYDYDLALTLAEDKGSVLKLEVASNLGALLEMLDSGKIDIAAYEIPITGENRSRAVPCGIERVTSQVLVQPKKKNQQLITDVTQLVGKDVFVEAGSKYHYRMLNLNDELGGGVNIHPVDRDTLITEEMIAMVSKGEIPLTVVDSDIAELNATYYPDLDITLQVSFPQRAAWAVAPGKEWLADSVDKWFEAEIPRNIQKNLLKRYFEISKREAGNEVAYPDFRSGRISPFDSLFRRSAAQIGWDWRLLAAMGYMESKFNPDVVSWAGAKGIMQIMPQTAIGYGVSPELLTDNGLSIATAAKIIASQEKKFEPLVPDPEERKKFIVAAYNSGAAHILDAIALAGKYGYDPTVWDGNVELALMLKANPEYYNDPVCKYGYFRGNQTFEYVRKVFAFYQRAISKIKP